MCCADLTCQESKADCRGLSMVRGLLAVTLRPGLPSARFQAQTDVVLLFVPSLWSRPGEVKGDVGLWVLQAAVELALSQGKATRVGKRRHEYTAVFACEGGFSMACPSEWDRSAAAAANDACVTRTTTTATTFTAPTTTTWPRTTRGSRCACWSRHLHFQLTSQPAS